MDPPELQPASTLAAPGLNFTAHMRQLCADIAARLPEFSHIDVELVAIRVCQTRKDSAHGIYASLTPLRLEGGRRVVVRGSRSWGIQPLRDSSGREMLYLLSFYLPRFCNQPFKEKLATIMHELWHIGPCFDGDLRRLPGRCFAHGHSAEEFHKAMRHWAERWLGAGPPQELFAFLEGDFRQLCLRYGKIFGTRVRTPKLIPLPRDGCEGY